MKRVITKFWGIGLVVVLLASLFVAAAPASGADLSFSTQGTPMGPGFTWQIAGGTDAALIKVASNGDIFAVDTSANATEAKIVYKSTTGGLFWAPSAPVAIGATAVVNIVDLEISPNYEVDGTVIILTNTDAPAPQAFISVNSGASFAVLGAALSTNEVGTSLAISPSYSGGTGEIMIGTSVSAGGFGDAYVWGSFGVLNWAKLNVGAGANTEDVMEVAFSPNYPIDATALCISANTTGTYLHTKVALQGWDATIVGAVAITDGAGTAMVAPGSTGNSTTSAVLAMPADFNGSLPLQRTLYAAINSDSPNDRIYRVIAGTALGLTKLQPSALVADAEHTSLVFAGVGATGILYAGTAGITGVLTPQVYRCANPGAVIGVTFLPATAPPTGTLTAAGPLTYVAVTADKIYAGTKGTDSGFSASDDGGVTFYQTGLIDTAIVTIQDFQAASSTDLFMITSDNATGAADSIWRTTDGGASWVRVLSLALATDTGIVRPSPAYATDATVYLGDLTSTAAGNIRMSNDGGATWAGRTCPIAIGDIAVKDQYTIYVGSSAAAVVQSTANGGWVWQPLNTTLTGATACNDLEIDLATGHLLWGDTGAVGAVYVSTNNNFTWVPQGGGVGGAAVVAFDTNYDTNNIIYGADTDNTTVGVQRFTTSAPTVAWAGIEGTTTLTLAPADLLVAPDGTLYASDVTPAAAAAGGIVRILDPAAFVVSTVERLNTGVWGDNLTEGDTLTILSMAEGSNILFAVNNIAVPWPNIRTYTDTLSSVAPAIASPDDGIILNPATIIVTVEAVTGALNYEVQWNTRPDFFGTGAVITIAWPGLSTAPLADIPAGTTIYYRTRAATPVFSQWSATRTVESQLTAALTTAPAIAGLNAIEGGTGPGGWDASINPTFQWGAIGQATAYEFQLATDAAMTNMLIDLSGADALGVVTAYKLTTVTLDYNTTYYWRVRALSATTNTDWTTATGFTTLAAPAAPPPPPVVIETTPAPVIEIPPAPPATVIEIPPAPPAEKISPSYIWAIIIIGAVLVIAVIVLIVRTRRQV